ncbi:YolD-like family protein [Alteribacter natronophilus]|uniref:YolD-like family protein n=1 Tax=Alteribacter natronophilus TaxID=2583810 RepID=UPI00110E951B|nr:YolD-like family protein [Alteribacter natronophilus]TMW71019.1 YolD-like family protein [Alteribacter natronophilus]
MNEKDRGTIKWTSLMLPEHVRMLKEHQQSYFKEPKPQLDPQQMEEFERTLCEAMARNCPLSLTCWKDGHFMQVDGYVHYINHAGRKLHLVTSDGEAAYVSFTDLTDVKVSD